MSHCSDRLLPPSTLAIIVDAVVYIFNIYILYNSAKTIFVIYKEVHYIIYLPACICLQVLDESSDEEEEYRRAKKASTKNLPCFLIWQGVAAKRSFKSFQFENCRKEALARKYLADKGVEHYWDMCRNATLEDAVVED